jgi:hypothetical protein
MGGEMSGRNKDSVLGLFTERKIILYVAGNINSLGHRCAERVAVRKQELCWKPLENYAKRAALRKRELCWKPLGN